VDDRLRVDHHVDPVERDVEEQVRLEHLERLVDHGRRVDRHDGAHDPGGMRQCLGRGDVGQRLPGTAAERAAAGRQDQPADLLAAAPAQALRQRRVLGVDRNHGRAGAHPLGHERPAGDQGLLVGEGQRAPGVERRERRRQTDGSGHGVEHRVAGHRRELGGRLRAREDLRHRVVAGAEAALLGGGVERELQVLRGGRAGHGHRLDAQLEGLLGQQVDVAAAGGQSDDPESVGVAAHDVECLGAHRPRRAEDDDVTSAGHPRILPYG
jgi:hypothetical protein